MRQEPTKGYCVRVVHLDRHGGGGLHLRLRRGRAEHGGRERVAGVRGRVDGEYLFVGSTDRLLLILSR